MADCHSRDFELVLPPTGSPAVPGVPSIPIAPNIPIRHRSPEHIFGCDSISMSPILTDYQFRIVPAEKGGQNAIAPVRTAFVRLVGHGSQVNAWTSLCEMKLLAPEK